MTDRDDDHIREELEKGYRLPGSGVSGGHQPERDEAGPPPSGGSGGKEPEPKK